jgi:hypothetical protein
MLSSMRYGTMSDYSTMELLHDAYHSIRDAWAALSNDQSRDDTAPWNSWRNVPEDTPITTRDVLLHVVEFSAADAGKSVLHHVAALAGAYRPDAVTAEGLHSTGGRASPATPWRAPYSKVPLLLACYCTLTPMNAPADRHACTCGRPASTARAAATLPRPISRARSRASGSL